MICGIHERSECSFPYTDSYVLEISRWEWVSQEQHILALSARYGDILQQLTRFVTKIGSGNHPGETCGSCMHVTSYPHSLCCH